jgi:hypothetical protein
LQYILCYFINQYLTVDTALTSQYGEMSGK